MQVINFSHYNHLEIKSVLIGLPNRLLAQEWVALVMRINQFLTLNLLEMLHFIFAFVVLVHGFVHLLGFAHELQFKEDEELSVKTLSKFKGFEKLESFLWLSAYALFLAAVILFMFYAPSWWIFATIGVLLSQILIFLDWQEAKYGTITNIIIVLVIIPFFMQV